MIQAFLELREIGKAFQAGADLLSGRLGVPLCIRCGFCCKHNTPPALTIEAINLVSVMTGEGKIPDIVSRAEGWLLDRDGFKIMEGMPAGAMTPALREEWAYSLSLPCPFQGADNQCIVHMARPMTCRAWGTVTDRHEICRRPRGKGETETKHAYVDAKQLRTVIDEIKEDWTRRNRSWCVSGQLPAMVMRTARPEKFKALVLDNKIPSAKIIGMELDTNLMWQPQLNAIRRGERPDLALLRRDT